MGKYYGQIGFATQQETEPGIWEDVVVERPYSGEYLDNRWRTTQGSGPNNDILLNCDFSVLCDPYLLKHQAYILYVTYMGVRWAVTGAVPNYPRILLTVGGVYNENTVAAPRNVGKPDWE